MGSLSNVAIVFSKDGYNEFCNKLTELFSESFVTHILDYIDHCTLKRNDIITGDKAYYWRYVKWQSFNDTCSASTGNPYFESYVINKTLSKINKDHYLLVDIGELNDDNYQVGYYINNSFGIGLKRFISGFEENEEHDSIEIAKILNYRNRTLIKDFTAKNIIETNIAKELKMGKHIKLNLCKLIFLYISYIDKNYKKDELINDLISRCIEIINCPKEFLKVEKEEYTISTLHICMVQNGIENLAHVKSTFGIITSALLYAIADILCFTGNTTEIRNTYSDINSSIRYIKMI